MTRVRYHLRTATLGALVLTVGALRWANNHDAAHGCQDRWAAQGHGARVVDLGPTREYAT